MMGRRSPRWYTIAYCYVSSSLLNHGHGRTRALTLRVTPLARLWWGGNQHQHQQQHVGGGGGGGGSIRSSLRRCYLTVDATTEDENCVDEPKDVTKIPRLYVGSPQALHTNITRLDKLTTTITNTVPTTNPLFAGSIVELSPDQSHYLTSVLRLHKSSNRRHYVRLFDGHNKSDWLASIILAGNRRNPTVTATVLRSLKSSTSTIPTTSYWLCVAPPKKKDRLKWLIEKTTELGVSGYLWLQTDYSQEFDDRKLVQYAIEASEQAERTRLPLFVTMDSSSVTTTPLALLLDAVEAAPGNLVTALVCRERSEQAVPLGTLLQQKHTPTPHCLILVGPEGGWSPTEEALLDRCSCTAVSLGPTVLRVETAAVAALAVVAAI